MGRRRWLRDGVVAAVATLAAVGCAASGPAGPLVRPVTVDPNATFVARERAPGFALERLPDGNTGELVPAASGSTQIVRVGQQDVAWLTVGPQEVVVRGGASDAAPVLGRVVSSWQDQAVRLSIEPKGQPVVTSESFRSGVGSGQIFLSRDATMALDLQGAFTSPLIGAGGKPVGWLRVRIDGDATSYEGAMPKGVSDAMAAAAMAALQHEVEFVTKTAGSNRPTDAR